MSPLERRAILYALADMNGADIDWDTGKISKKREV